MHCRTFALDGICIRYQDLTLSMQYMGSKLRSPLGPMLLVLKIDPSTPHALLSGVKCGLVPFCNLTFHILEVAMLQQHCSQLLTLGVWRGSLIVLKANLHMSKSNYDLRFKVGMCINFSSSCCYSVPSTALIGLPQLQCLFAGYRLPMLALGEVAAHPLQ